MYAGIWKVEPAAVSCVDFILGVFQDFVFSNHFLLAPVQGLTDSTGANRANDQSEEWETANRQSCHIAIAPTISRSSPQSSQGNVFFPLASKSKADLRKRK